MTKSVMSFKFDVVAVTSLTTVGKIGFKSRVLLKRISFCCRAGSVSAGSNAIMVNLRGTTVEIPNSSHMTSELVQSGSGFGAVKMVVPLTQRDRSDWTVYEIEVTVPENEDVEVQYNGGISATVFMLLEFEI